jgi:hypothetical protein
MVLKNIGNWISRTSNGLTQSKVVLYVLVGLVIVNLYNYSLIGDELYAGVMILVGFLTSFFSKNMIVILFTAIAVTNIIRFGMEINNREGFGGLDVDGLTDHLTSTEQDEPSAEDIKQKLSGMDMDNINKQVSDQMKSMNLEETELNTDPSKRDETIDRLMKGVTTNSTLTQLDKSLNVSQLELARDKLNLAMKHSNRIVNEKQRKEVESIFAIQMKLIDQLLNVSPLVNEFKEVLKSVNA